MPVFFYWVNLLLNEYEARHRIWPKSFPLSIKRTNGQNSSKIVEKNSREKELKANFDTYETIKMDDKIPVIDLSNIESEHSEKKKLRRAITKFGVFYVTNHGIPALIIIIYY